MDVRKEIDLVNHLITVVQKVTSLAVHLIMVVIKDWITVIR